MSHTTSWPSSLLTTETTTGRMTTTTIETDDGVPSSESGFSSCSTSSSHNTTSTAAKTAAKNGRLLEQQQQQQQQQATTTCCTAVMKNHRGQGSGLQQSDGGKDTTTRIETTAAFASRDRDDDGVLVHVPSLLSGYPPSSTSHAANAAIFTAAAGKKKNNRRQLLAVVEETATVNRGLPAATAAADAGAAATSPRENNIRFLSIRDDKTNKTTDDRSVMAASGGRDTVLPLTATQEEEEGCCGSAVVASDDNRKIVAVHSQQPSTTRTAEMNNRRRLPRRAKAAAIAAITANGGATTRTADDATTTTAKQQDRMKTDNTDDSSGVAAAAVAGCINRDDDNTSTAVATMTMNQLSDPSAVAAAPPRSDDRRIVVRCGRNRGKVLPPGNRSYVDACNQLRPNYINAHRQLQGDPTAAEFIKQNMVQVLLGRFRFVSKGQIELSEEEAMAKIVRSLQDPRLLKEADKDNRRQLKKVKVKKATAKTRKSLRDRRRQSKQVNDNKMLRERVLLEGGGGGGEQQQQQQQPQPQPQPQPQMITMDPDIVAGLFQCPPAPGGSFHPPHHLAGAGDGIPPNIAARMYPQSINPAFLLSWGTPTPHGWEQQCGGMAAAHPPTQQQDCGNPSAALSPAAGAAEASGTSYPAYPMMGGRAYAQPAAGRRILEKNTILTGAPPGGFSSSFSYAATAAAAANRQREQQATYTVLYDGTKKAIHRHRRVLPLARTAATIATAAANCKNDDGLQLPEHQQQATTTNTVDGQQQLMEAPATAVIITGSDGEGEEKKDTSTSTTTIETTVAGNSDGVPSSTISYASGAAVATAITAAANANGLLPEANTTVRNDGLLATANNGTLTRIILTTDDGTATARTDDSSVASGVPAAAAAAAAGCNDDAPPRTTRRTMLNHPAAAPPPPPPLDDDDDDDDGKPNSDRIVVRCGKYRGKVLPGNQAYVQELDRLRPDYLDAHIQGHDEVKHAMIRNCLRQFRFISVDRVRGEGTTGVSEELVEVELSEKKAGDKIRKSLVDPRLLKDAEMRERVEATMTEQQRRRPRWTDAAAGCRKKKPRPKKTKKKCPAQRSSGKSALKIHPVDLPPHSDQPLLLRRKVWNGTHSRGSAWKSLYHRPPPEPQPQPPEQQEESQQQEPQEPEPEPQPEQQQTPGCFVHHFSPAGKLCIYPNLLSRMQQTEITDELLHSDENCFRQYRVQNQNEPRVHFLLHPDATDNNFDSAVQPGYRYGSVRMKSRPLQPKFPCLAKLGEQLEQQHYQHQQQSLMMTAAKTDTTTTNNESSSSLFDKTKDTTAIAAETNNDNGTITESTAQHYLLHLQQQPSTTTNNAEQAAVEMYATTDTISRNTESSDKDRKDSLEGETTTLSPQLSTASASTVASTAQVQQLSTTERIIAANDDANEPFWNIGVNPVLYRDGRDRIGYHADDDQGEQLVFTVLVASPANTTPRCIRIRPKHRSGVEEEDELLELYLDAGDAYSMDGDMQEYYTHSVPTDLKSVATTTTTVQQEQESRVDVPSQDASQQQQQHRIAIVFRRGTQVLMDHDSGKPFASLVPRPPMPYIFGNQLAFAATTPVTISTAATSPPLAVKKLLIETATYTRSELYDMGLHHSQQGGVSGGKFTGCDAIIVAGRRPDGLGCDHLHQLVYAANTREGALALLANYNNVQMPVRVFRSSALISVYRALFAENAPTPTRNRYDGLYKVDTVYYTNNSDESVSDSEEKSDGHEDNTSANSSIIYHVRDPHEHLAAKRLPSRRIYLFSLVRCCAKENDPVSNVLNFDDFVRHAIKKRTLSWDAVTALRKQEHNSAFEAMFAHVRPECDDCSSMTSLAISNRQTVRKKPAEIQHPSRSKNPELESSLGKRKSHTRHQQERSQEDYRPVDHQSFGGQPPSKRRRSPRFLPSKSAEDCLATHVASPSSKLLRNKNVVTPMTDTVIHPANPETEEPSQNSQVTLPS